MVRELNPEMYDEWQAWLVVGTEFKALGLDMNEKRVERLVRAIELWGEKLVDLRMHQSPDIILSAHDDAMRKAEIAGLVRG